MYYNLLQNWQKPFTVEMYRNINLLVMIRLNGCLVCVCAEIIRTTARSAEVRRSSDMALEEYVNN